MTVPAVVVEGGDRACGELLLVLAARTRRISPGVVVRLVASDPAAPLDVPAWCHLTGHEFVGRVLTDDGRACYDVRVRAGARASRPDRPWQLQNGAPQLTTERTSR